MTANEFLIAVAAGAALAAPYVFYAQRSRNRRAVFAIGLVAAAAIYVAFAIWSGTVKGVLIELCGVVVFGILAALGIRRSRYFLALGWAAHVSWDLLLH